MFVKQAQFGASPQNLVAPLVLANHTALSLACEMCEAEALFSKDALNKCNPLAGSTLAEQVTGKIVAVMVPHPEGSTGSNGLPESCSTSFGEPATVARAGAFQFPRAAT